MGRVVRALKRSAWNGVFPRGFALDRAKHNSILLALFE